MLNKNGQQTSWKQELIAGFIGYFTTVYIVAVNSQILSDAGLPLETGMVATIAASALGCLLIALYANAPMVLIPGMGINALFAYSIVEGNGFTYEQGLAVVVVASLLFVITAFTSLGAWLSRALPVSLIHAITVGIGFFLALLGLEKGGVVVKGEQSLIALGDPTSPVVLTTLATLFIAIFLFAKNVPGNFLVTLVIGTLIAYFVGILEDPQPALDFGAQQWVFAPDFSVVVDFSFWMGVFPLALVIIFENMGLIHGQLDMVGNKTDTKFHKSYQATAFSSLTSGFLGTSPTVSSAESAAVIAAGGKTWRASITMAVLFVATLFLIPWISIVPSTAISPILIIVGSLMVQEIRHIPFDDLSESLPAFLMIAMIPFTYSIPDGMAFGFIAYPLVKLAMGKQKELTVAMVLIALAFFIEFLLRASAL
ncbi:NCS2 family permease [Salimicrobium flavidum]|uniref:Putative MFS transporter, AGZA family, xanthine/uracil permease n=1 Tax=Salimicrobium flavidum TaxID=570947 RepID=A0A1N7IL13_9BACI|nr:NCS2 family permease [Salimicrobium flavidum]SIS37783.1 putative MFS transporter, AGZA family, xanthine/uracil permease [Salimicrobium flavidum]